MPYPLHAADTPPVQQQLSMIATIVLSSLALFFLFAHLYVWLFMRLNKPKTRQALIDLCGPVNPDTLPKQQQEEKVPSAEYLRSMTQPILRAHLYNTFGPGEAGASQLVSLPEDPCSDSVIFRSLINRRQFGQKLPETLRPRLDSIITRWFARISPSDAAQYSGMLTCLLVNKYTAASIERSDLANALVMAFLTTPKYCKQPSNCTDPMCPWVSLHKQPQVVEGTNRLPAQDDCK